MQPISVERSTGPGILNEALEAVACRFCTKEGCDGCGGSITSIPGAEYQCSGNTLAICVYPYKGKFRIPAL